jgi:putative transposase
VSRWGLVWRRFNTLTTVFCLDAVQETITRYGTPTIFNTDQWSQITSQEFMGLLKHYGIQISMYGKGCWRDNAFVERLGKIITSSRSICTPTWSSAQRNRAWNDT